MAIKRKHEMGSGGNCVCLNCDMKLPIKEVSLAMKNCPDCCVMMVRAGLEHHLLMKEREKVIKVRRHGH